MGLRRVLIVDDEPALLRALARGLRSSFEVVTASSAKEALEHLQADSSYWAVVTDLSMPEGGGLDLDRAIARGWPELGGRVVFMTGGACDERTARWLEGRTTLKKPLTALELERGLLSLPPLEGR